MLVLRHGGLRRLAGWQPVYRQRVPEEHGSGNEEGIPTMNFARVQGWIMFGIIAFCFLFPTTPPITRMELLMLTIGGAICLSIGHLPQEKKEDSK